MIKSITVTNYLNDSITMELMNPEKSGFIITKIDGLGPGKATINKTEIANNDGSLYNSARFNSRSIVLGVRFLQGYSSSIETLRQLSYKYFPIKRKIKISVKTDNREAYIYGYVESNEPNIFSDKEEANISVICPDPYFYSCGKDGDNEIDFSGTEPLFEFPFYGGEKYEKDGELAPEYLFTEEIPNGHVYPDFSDSDKIAQNKIDNIRKYNSNLITNWRIKHVAEYNTNPDLSDIGYGVKPVGISYEYFTSYLCRYVKPEGYDLMEDKIEFGAIEIHKEQTVYYEGDAEVGMMIYIHALGEVRNITIYNILTRESMSIDTSKIETITGSGIVACDDIIINTVRGSKGIKLIRSGVEYNILNALDVNADWFQLSKGDNVFSYTAEYGSNNLQFRITNQVLYEGI